MKKSDVKKVGCRTKSPVSELRDLLPAFDRTDGRPPCVGVGVGVVVGGGGDRFGWLVACRQHCGTHTASSVSYTHLTLPTIYSV